MFSKATELTGLGLIAWGLGLLLGFPAALIFSGISLVFIGSMTKDDAVGLVIRRGWAWFKWFYWHRQILTRGDRPQRPAGPQPEIVEDPIAKQRAEQMARQRLARQRLHDEGDAMSRPMAYDDQVA